MPKTVFIIPSLELASESLLELLAFESQWTLPQRLRLPVLWQQT